MLGMKETLKNILIYLKDAEKVQYFAFERLQIKYTCRYLIFWSFTHLIPRDHNFQLALSSKAKRTQTIEINSDQMVGLISNIQEKYCDEIFEFDDDDEDFFFELTLNKWSRKYRRNPQTAAALQCPIKISIKKLDQFIEFELMNDEIENEDWDNFVGFVDHLRKEIKLNQTK